MSELEIKCFDEKNQETVAMLHHVQANLIEEKSKIKNSMHRYILPKFLKQYGKQVTVAAGVITLVVSCATLQSLGDTVLLTSEAMVMTKGIESFCSLLLIPEKTKIEKVRLLEEQIKKCREEADIRYQVEVYLSYGMILGTIGYYEKALQNEWVENDEILKFFIRKMITQLIQDDRLEHQNPKQYEELLKERERLLDISFHEHPEKIYLLARSTAS